MSRICQICGKKPQVGRKLNKLRGKYNPTPKRVRYPNLQWVKIPKDIKKQPFRKFAGKRVLACTRCIKTLSKIQAK
ncbi:50S ribosomal protein L28 [bacterium]|nr:50S ribosomal protein L28 [bacterium]